MARLPSGNILNSNWQVTLFVAKLIKIKKSLQFCHVYIDIEKNYDKIRFNLWKSKTIIDFFVHLLYNIKKL